MINYILKSIICAAVLFAFYRIFLLPEKMNRFKRWYLLVTLFSALLIPVLPMEMPLLPSPFPIGQDHTANQSFQDVAMTPTGQLTSWPKSLGTAMTTGSKWLIIIYGLIVCVLLFRILDQLFRFWRMVRRFPKEQHNKDGICLIQLPQGQLSFSFMQYICIAPTDTDARSGKPLRDIYLHELAHAKGHHSIDVLIISLLQALFWWNPFLWLYKKAIQLNHEFLADEFVLKANGQTARYQRLLLSRIRAKPTMTLGSTSIYSLTKKRFKMMMQHTPKRKIRLLQAAGACVASLCLLVLSQHTVAQDTAIQQKTTSANNPLSQDPTDTKQKGVSPTVFKAYQKEMASHRDIKGKDTSWHFHFSEGKKMNELMRIYHSMSPEQQKKAGRFPPPPPPPPPAKIKKGATKAPPPPPPPPPASVTKQAAGIPVPSTAAPSTSEPFIKAVHPLPATSPLNAVEREPATDKISLVTPAK